MGSPRTFKQFQFSDHTSGGLPSLFYSEAGTGEIHGNGISPATNANCSDMVEGAERQWKGIGRETIAGGQGAALFTGCRRDATLPVQTVTIIPMTITVNEKTRQLFPASVRRQAGIKTGDQLEVKVSGGIITLLPKLPSADDEYTPKQRRVIDARIAEGLDDVKHGRVSRAFATHEEFIA